MNQVPLRVIQCSVLFCIRRTPNAQPQMTLKPGVGDSTYERGGDARLLA